MTIVLIVIILIMDNFEGKIRRSSTCVLHNSQPPISVRYKKRMLKILFFYLLTSLLCWSPLLFCLVYRVVRKPTEVPQWFYLLIFIATLLSSLSAVLNPIIFGFISQPYREILSNLFRVDFFGKLMCSKGNPKDASDRRQDDAHQMVVRSKSRPLEKSNNNPKLDSKRHNTATKHSYSSNNTQNGLRGGLKRHQIAERIVNSENKRVSFKSNSNDHHQLTISSPRKGAYNDGFEKPDDVNLEAAPSEQLANSKTMEKRVMKGSKDRLSQEKIDKVSLESLDIEKDLAENANHFNGQDA